MERRTAMTRCLNWIGLAPLVVGSRASAASAPAVQGSEARALQKRVGDVASLADQLEIRDFDDIAFAARLAFEQADTSKGRGVSFRVPPRIMVMKAPLVVPDRIVLLGSGMRDSIFQAMHDGPMFVFRDVNLAGLSNVRLGLGARSGTQGISIEARDGDLRRLTFGEIEIAGGGPAGSGQVGVSIAASGRRIVTESAFDRLILTEIDRPVVERNTEGNEWSRFVIDQFGYRGGVAFDSVANANHYQGRIAGIPAPGAIGFCQRGFRNIMMLRVDIGNDARALDIAPDTRNIVMLQRPAEAGPPAVQTPIGRAIGSTVIDGDGQNGAGFG